MLVLVPVRHRKTSYSVALGHYATLTLTPRQCSHSGYWSGFLGSSLGGLKILRASAYAGSIPAPGTNVSEQLATLPTATASPSPKFYLLRLLCRASGIGVGVAGAGTNFAERARTHRVAAGQERGELTEYARECPKAAARQRLEGLLGEERE